MLALVYTRNIALHIAELRDYHDITAIHISKIGTTIFNLHIHPNAIAKF